VKTLLQQSLAFSFQYDESQDKSKESILAVMAHVVVAGRKRCVFIGCMRVTRKTGMHLFQGTRMLIAATAGTIDMRRLVGIGADGTGSNTGRESGAVTFWQQLLPWVKFTHCAAHRLALAVQNAASKDGNKNVIDFLRAFETLFVFYTYEGQWPRTPVPTRA
jgi:hypothetical protein